MRDVKEFKAKVEELKIQLPAKEKSLISLKSVENFLIWFDKLPSCQQETIDLLEGYFQLLDDKKLQIDKTLSNKIAFDYILKIGSYYSKYLGFKIQMSLTFALIIGTHSDVILLLFGLLKYTAYVPIVTSCILIYWFYLKFCFEKRHMVHNARY